MPFIFFICSLAPFLFSFFDAGAVVRPLLSLMTMTMAIFSFYKFTAYQFVSLARAKERGRKRRRAKIHHGEKWKSIYIELQCNANAYSIQLIMKIRICCSNNLYANTLRTGKINNKIDDSFRCAAERNIVSKENEQQDRSG